MRPEEVDPLEEMEPDSVPNKKMAKWKETSVPAMRVDQVDWVQELSCVFPRTPQSHLKHEELFI